MLEISCGAVHVTLIPPAARAGQITAGARREEHGRKEGGGRLPRNGDWERCMVFVGICAFLQWKVFPAVLLLKIA
ncbi:hypothetical protein C0Q70_16138 [Pomacea canaliculata]|uniref:Uncharacterized protein n=1 Tax=Pomacea canaliculata TaxID=400727 RepID=A0A2T7NNX8_POMCA|nr:hypothetical protein C0Q70_16138 [Pomacea canaliculata]